MTIKDGKMTTLTIRKPSFDVTLEQRKNRLSVGHVFTAKNGILFHGVADPDQFSSTETLVAIRDDHGWLLTEGRPYNGKSGKYEFEWKIPPTLKKGDKLKVSVTWETEFW